MPPKPPDGAFDIRFFGDMMICNNDSCFIEVTSDYDSLNINFIINDLIIESMYGSFMILRK